MEEERRNCFVAITRTRECLVLSRAEVIEVGRKSHLAFSLKWNSLMLAKRGCVPAALVAVKSRGSYGKVIISMSPS